MDWQDLMLCIKTVAMKLNSKCFLWALLIAASTCIFLLPVLRGEFLHWDDRALFVENPYYRGLSPSHWQWMCTTVMLGHWQPLSWLSYALDYKAWGMNPQGWHAVNLLIHIVNAVLVYLLCLAFLKEQRRRYATVALAALFWAVHPLRVEAVAWLSTRGYLLCGTFSLLTVLLYLRAVERKRYPLAALICFALATFTKGIGMMLPLVLLLMDWHRAWGMEHGADGTGPWKWWRKRVVEKIPFFTLSFVTGVTAFLAKRADGGMASVEIYGPVQRVGQAVYGAWFYLLKTVSPQNLSPLYEKRPELWLVLTALLLSTAAGIFLFLFRRKVLPIIGTLGAFLLLVFPMLGITQSGSQMFADRFTYLAAVPFSILLAAGLARLKPLRRTVCGALAALVLILGIQSAAYSKVWKNGLSLWSYAVSVDGSQSGTQNNLGLALLGCNAYENALECFNKALEIRPDYADALNNRALIEFHAGEYKKALDDLNKALMQDRISVTDRAKMQIARGIALEELHDSVAAIADYSAVIEEPDVDPGRRLLALQGRARLAVAAGQIETAKMDLETMLSLPDVSGSFHQMAEMVLAKIKKIPKE
jgi:hypothetical protein